MMHPQGRNYAHVLLQNKISKMSPSTSSEIMAQQASSFTYELRVLKRSNQMTVSCICACTIPLLKMALHTKKDKYCIPGVVISDWVFWFNQAFICCIQVSVYDCNPCEFQTYSSVAHLTVQCIDTIIMICWLITRQCFHKTSHLIRIKSITHMA